MEDIGSVSEPMEQALTQARHVLSSSETDWSNEQRHEIETLINDIEQLRDVVFIASSYLVFTALFLSALLFTHQHSIAERGGCFQWSMFVCHFVCLFAR